MCIAPAAPDGSAEEGEPPCGGGAPGGPAGGGPCITPVMTDIALDFDTSPARRIRFESRPNAAIAARAAGVPVLDVVIPVYNEQAALADSVYRLHRHLRDDFPFPARITIADNASVDDTSRIAHELAAELTDVRVVRLEQKGRGRALHAVWATSDAPVLAYMGVELVAGVGP